MILCILSCFIVWQVLSSFGLEVKGSSGWKCKKELSLPTFPYMPTTKRGRTWWQFQWTGNLCFRLRWSMSKVSRIAQDHKQSSFACCRHQFLSIVHFRCVTQDAVNSFANSQLTAITHCYFLFAFLSALARGLHKL